MGAVHRGVEPAVDGLLDAFDKNYVLRKKSSLGNAVNLDKTKGAVGPLPQSEYALEPPWRHIADEAFVGESDDFCGVEDSLGDAEEERHPRSLTPVRVPIPPGLESSGQKAGLLMSAAIGAAAGVVGCIWTFAPTIPQNEWAENKEKIILAAPVAERSQAAVVPKSGLSVEPVQRSARVMPESPATSGASAPQPLSIAGPIVAPQFEQPTLRDPQAVRRLVNREESGGQPEGAASRESHTLSGSAERPQRKLDAAQIALMLKNGTELLANGSIGAARMMFQSAAEAGDPVAAFALAETYDPVVLAKMGVKGGISPDIVLARRWYAKAKDLGSTTAPERLARLER